MEAEYNLNPDELECKYNNLGKTEHPTYLRTMWIATVVSLKTDFGYWEWVYCELQKERNITGR